MLRIFKFLISLFIIFFFTTVYGLESDWSMGIESQTRIVSPFTHNNDQNEFYIGLEYKLKKDWKTYWRSSGEGGFPQEIVWKSSQNVKDLEIFWPKPKYFEILGQMDNLDKTTYISNGLDIDNAMNLVFTNNEFELGSDELIEYLENTILYSSRFIQYI